jgi:hypothetical protein
MGSVTHFGVEAPMRPEGLSHITFRLLDARGRVI